MAYMTAIPGKILDHEIENLYASKLRFARISISSCRNKNVCITLIR